MSDADHGDFAVCAHPGVWRYRAKGCRCRGCVDAWARFRADRLALTRESRGWTSCDAPSRARYSNSKCRCAECRHLNSEYQQEQRLAHAASGKRPNGQPPLSAHELEYLRRIVGFTPEVTR